MQGRNKADTAVSYRQLVADQGFAVIHSVLDTETVDSLRQAVTRLPDSDAVRRKRGVYGIRNLLGVLPEARTIALDDRIFSIAESVLGPDTFAARAVFFDKPADANWKLGYHQDSVIAVREKVDTPGFEAWSTKAGILQVQPPAEVMSSMLAIRIHLDDCGSDNGPLRVIPGSHCHGWLDDEIDQWKGSVDEVTCVTDAGGLLVMSPMILHASSTAERPGHRRVIHLEYAACDLPGQLEWADQLRP